MKSSRVKHVSLLLAGPLAIVIASAWIYLHGGGSVSTDNAYIKADIVSVSSELSGRVMETFVRDNQRVERDQLLYVLDDRPYKLALMRAEAQLADARSAVSSLQQEYRQAELEITNATARVEYLAKELERVRSLRARGSVSESQLDQLQYEWQDASNTRREKEQSLEVIKARLGDPARPLDEHPQVQQALAQVDSARLDLSHVEVRAPIDGIAVNVSALRGETVVAGAPLLSIVDDQHLWLEANFKETDLTHLQPGQPVNVKVDTFPDQRWTGHVDSITPATGAEFSLLPAQNASGNWVKVVQRITVRIELDDYQGDRMLAAGMSAEVDVDIGQKRSLPLIGSL
ncbi:MAG TPA: HlyD family secretion protein [Pseudohongiella sp.]|nr:HlyD family secretion protein [Pseudohongiella sp.]